MIRPAFAQWLVLGLALIALGCAVAFNLYLEHGYRVASEQDRLSINARIIAENMERQLASADIALKGIRDDQPNWKGSFGLQGEMRRLKAFSNAMPGIRYIGVLDAKGTLLASNLPEFIGSDFSSRDYYQTVKRRPSADTLYISPPFKSRHGPYAVNLTRMISGPHGEFAGVVTASLDPAYFKTLMASVLYAPDMVDMIAYGDGTLFVMVPEREGTQGLNVAQPDSFFSRHRDSGKVATVFTGAAYSSKEVQIMAQRTVQPGSLKMDKPLVVAVSRDLDTVIQPWRHGALIQSGLFGLVAIFSMLGLYGYQRHRRLYERQAAEAAAALRQSEERFRSAFDAAATGMVLVSLEGHFMQANAAFCRITGYTQAELLQKTFQDITHPDDLETNLALTRGLLAGTRDSYLFQKRYFHQDGHEIWVLVGAAVVHEADGKALYFVAQIQDITERRRAEEAFRNESKKIEMLLNTVSDGIHVLDIEGNVKQVNDAFCRMLGYSKEQLLTMNVTQFDARWPEKELKAILATLMHLTSIRCSRPGTAEATAPSSMSKSAPTRWKSTATL